MRATYKFDIRYRRQKPIRATPQWHCQSRSIPHPLSNGNINQVAIVCACPDTIKGPAPSGLRSKFWWSSHPRRWLKNSHSSSPIGKSFFYPMKIQEKDYRKAGWCLRFPWFLSHLKNKKCSHQIQYFPSWTEVQHRAAPVPNIVRL